MSEVKMSDCFWKKAEDSNRKLTEALDRLHYELSSYAGGDLGKETVAVDGSSSSLRTSVGEVEELIDVLRSAYEDRVHRFEHEHSQYRTGSEQREQSIAKLLQDYERENEELIEKNHSLLQELKILQMKLRATDSSLKEKERSVSSLTEQLGIHQENHEEVNASHKASEKEAEEKLKELKWRVREEERVRGEKEKELEQSRDMERTLKNTLLECQEQLQSTHKQLLKTQQELHSTEATLALTNEDLNAVKHQLQPKEEELQALQERIGDRAQQLMELLDRRSGDYSRQIQEEIIAQSHSYDSLVKIFAKNRDNSFSGVEDQFSPSRSVDIATCLRDFLNPHLLMSHPSLTTLHTHTDSAHSTIAGAYQRYLNTFTDFTQRIRVGEFVACPKSRVRLHRLQQWRHQFKEISLKPPTGLKIEEYPLCDVIGLIKSVSEKLNVAPTSLLIYTIDKSRFGGTTIKLWVLRRSLGSTVQYEADTMLTDLSLGGHRMTFVSLADPHGAPSPMEQWEIAHHRVVGRLEESPMIDVTRGAGRRRTGEDNGEGRTRANSMDMIDLDPAQSTARLLVNTELEQIKEDKRSDRRDGGRRVGVARRAGFHLKALAGLLCCCCTAGSHGTQYQHLEEIHTSDVT